jgi:hypothetical protein
MSYITNKDQFKQNKKYYIYIHYTLDKVPFYVGKGVKNRCLDKANRSKWWNNVVCKYGYYIKIQEINLNEDECFQREVFWINYFGRKQLKEGTLVNLTNGGEGVSGRVYTKEERLLKSNFWKENLTFLQKIGKRENYFGKILKGKYNPNYGNKGKDNPISIPVVKIDLKGNFISRYESLIEAEISNDVKGVYQVCKGQRHQLKGFKYIYEEDYISGNYVITRGKTSKKQVLKISLKTNKIIKEYNSTQETKIDDFFPNHVARACRGERKTYKGFKWKYKQDIV